MGSAWRIAVSVVHRCSSLRTPSSPGASRTGVGRCMAVGGGTPSGWNREYLSPHSPPHLPLSSHKRPPLPHPPYPRLRRTSTPSSRPPPIQRPAVTCRSPSQALSAGASRRSVVGARTGEGRFRIWWTQEFAEDHFFYANWCCLH